MKVEELAIVFHEKTPAMGFFCALSAFGGAKNYLIRYVIIVHQKG